MNLVKFYAGFILLIALILLSLNFFSPEKKGQEIYFSEGEIAPFEQWDEIIIGKWKFNAEIKGLKKIQVYEGQVEYHSDSTCAWGLHYNMYEGYEAGTVEKSKNDLKVSGGIVRECDWTIDIDGDDVSWEEDNCVCQDKLSYSSSGNNRTNLCAEIKKWFWVFWENNFYMGMNNATILKPIEFNKDRIVFQEQDFGSNAINYYIFTKIAD